jgi:hypothetical protein
VCACLCFDFFGGGGIRCDVFWQSKAGVYVSMRCIVLCVCVMSCEGRCVCVHEMYCVMCLCDVLCSCPVLREMKWRFRACAWAMHPLTWRIIYVMYLCVYIRTYICMMHTYVYVYTYTGVYSSS